MLQIDNNNCNGISYERDNDANRERIACIRWHPVVKRIYMYKQITYMYQYNKYMNLNTISELKFNKQMEKIQYNYKTKIDTKMGIKEKSQTQKLNDK